MNMVTKKTGMTLIGYDFQSSWFICMENDFNEELDIPPLGNEVLSSRVP